jgi:low affinity Fe/Cu permease
MTRIKSFGSFISYVSSKFGTPILLVVAAIFAFFCVVELETWHFRAATEDGWAVVFFLVLSLIDFLP